MIATCMVKRDNETSDRRYYTTLVVSCSIFSALQVHIDGSCMVIVVLLIRLGRLALSILLLKVFATFLVCLWVANSVGVYGFSSPLTEDIPTNLKATSMIV